MKRNLRSEQTQGSGSRGNRMRHSKRAKNWSCLTINIILQSKQLNKTTFCISRLKANEFELYNTDPLLLCILSRYPDFC